MSKRTGNRCKYGRPGRKPSGLCDRHGNRLDRKTRDEGTAELQRRRNAIVGATQDQPSNPALSEYPLGALLARGLIEDREHLAGCIFAGQHSGAVPPRPRAQTLQWANFVAQSVDQDILPDDAKADRPDETPEQRRARMWRSYDRARSRILEVSRRALDEVWNVCVEQRWPPVLTRRGQLAGENAALTALREGLRALAAHYHLPKDAGARRAA